MKSGIEILTQNSQLSKLYAELNVLTTEIIMVKNQKSNESGDPVQARKIEDKIHQLRFAIQQAIQFCNKPIHSNSKGFNRMHQGHFGRLKGERHKLRSKLEELLIELDTIEVSNGNRKGKLIMAVANQLSNKYDVESNTVKLQGTDTFLVLAACLIALIKKWRAEE
jgi:hypothetical protein